MVRAVFEAVGELIVAAIELQASDANEQQMPCAMLPNTLDASISGAIVARTGGGICMISIYSQTAPSRPMLMPDVRWAL
jgi:hypothetical protein